VEEERGGAWRTVAGLVRQWAGELLGRAGEKRRGRKGAGRGGGGDGVFGPNPKGRVLLLFIFCFPSLLKQTYFKTFSKPNLNSF